MAGVRRASERSPPVKLEIVDVEKVKGLSNYYAYIIKVLCKDGSGYTIYRRYSQFDEMHNALEKRFPIEAGAIKAKDRVLPTLPAKKFFGRSAIREVTDRRLPLLNTYLQGLFSLPDKIRYDTIVNAFTRPTTDDLARPYAGNQAYKSRANGAVKPDRPARPQPPRGAEKPQRPPPMAKPQIVISQGPRPLRPVEVPSKRVPPSMPLPSRPSATQTSMPLPSRPSAAPSNKAAKGRAIYSYTAMHPDELSFQEGEILYLSQQVDKGMWWKATCKGKSGLAPANYIELIKKPVVQNFRDRVQDSDEWDSSDEEDGGGAPRAGSIVYYYNQAARSVEVPLELINKPNYVSLYRAIQKQIRAHNITLNYKDSDGDLVQIIDQQDIQLLSTDATPPPTPTSPRQQLSKTERAPWAIYVTASNDTSVYNTAPPV